MIVRKSRRVGGWCNGTVSSLRSRRRTDHCKRWRTTRVHRLPPTLAAGSGFYAHLRLARTGGAHRSPADLWLRGPAQMLAQNLEPECYCPAEPFTGSPSAIGTEARSTCRGRPDRPELLGTRAPRLIQRSRFRIAKLVISRPSAASGRCIPAASSGQHLTVGRVSPSRRSVSRLSCSGRLPTRLVRDS